MRLFISVILVLFLAACTTSGKLGYVTSTGEYKTACETEYTWEPSVDKYAVEYTLGYCAKQAVKRGYKVIDGSLLNIDLSIPESPKGTPWTFEYARELHNKNKLSDQEYGYIIAYIDLGLNTN